MVMRLIVAAVLTVIIHGALLAAKIPWVTPKLLTPQNREVTISLVNVKKSTPAPEALPAPPKPKPPPKPKRRPKPKPKAKPTVKPRKPEPPPAPMPAPVKETVPPPEADDSLPVPDDLLPFEQFEDAALSPPTAEESGAVIELSVPLYDINPPPNYPRMALRRRYEGTVLLDVLVDKTGRAVQVNVAQSSGYAVLDRSAKADVSHWRFKPARKGMQTVEMWVKVPVRYELKN